MRTKLAVHFNHSAYSDAQLHESILDILEKNALLAMATVKSGESYINTAFYAYTDLLELLIFTEPSTQHSQNVAIQPSVAVALWNTPPIWGEQLQGLQLFGICQRVEERTETLTHAIRVFTERFPDFQHIIATPADFASGKTERKFYKITVQSLKLIDEPRFGRRKYITLQPMQPS